MKIIRTALMWAPVTTVFLLSALGFAASAMASTQAIALVLFYVFAVPYYLVALLAGAIAIEFDIVSARAAALGLVVSTDIALNVLRAAALSILHR